MKALTMKNLELRLHQLENRIGYVFNDLSKLLTAICHSSYVNQDRQASLTSNERYEFLGDAVLNIAVSLKIFNELNGLSEGEMTKMRASIVCKPSLVRYASAIGLGDFLLLGKGEEITGGRSNTSIIEDCYEALIAAIYLDGGFEKVIDFIERTIPDLTSGESSNPTFMDYKSELQEFVQKAGDKTVSYNVYDETGPDHDKLFFSMVMVGNDIIGKGKGKSKKAAEQEAARVALEKLRK